MFRISKYLMGYIFLTTYEMEGLLLVKSCLGMKTDFFDARYEQYQ
jgi:hypothetical protein